MANIGYATLSIIGSARDLGAQLTRDIAPQMESAGAAGGSALSKAISNHAVQAGAAIAGIGVALYKVGETFDDVADTIRVGTGATGDALEGLTNSAKNVGRDIPASFADIGTTIADLNTRLGLTGPTLEKLSSQFLEAGRITGSAIDVGPMTAAFSAFNITGEDTTRAMDDIYRISQATGVGMNELANSVVKGAPQLKQFGFSLQDSTALLGMFDKAGIGGDKTVAALSRGLVEFAKQGKNPQEALRGTITEIESFTKAGNAAGAINVAEKIFGTRGATAFVDAVQSGKVNLDKLMESTGATSDTILGAAADTNDFAESWQLFKNNVLLAVEPIATRVFNAVGSGMQFLVDHQGALVAIGTVLAGVVVPTILVATIAWAANTVAVNLNRVATAAAAVQSAVMTAYTWLGVTAINAQALATRVAGAAMAAYSFATSGTVLATLRSTAANAAHAVVSGTVRLATMAWTGVQWLLNAALTANPIGLVVVAIAALVAGVILAYKNSETFRQIVMAAWQGIQTAASFAWNSVIKPVFEGLRHFIMDEVVPAVLHFWHNAVEPAFAAIGQIIGFVWNNIVKPIFAAYRFYIMDIVVPAIMWLWQNVVAPAFAAIGQIIAFAWNNIIMPTFAALKFYISEVVAPIITWLWQNIVQPVFSSIGSHISGIWNNVIKPTFDILKAGLGLVGDAFSFYWNNVIKPIWTALGDGIRFVYENVIQPVWDRLKSALSVVGEFFSTVVGGIKSKWDELREAISAPIRVVIDFLGNTLGGAWNKIRGILPILKEFPKLAGGGTVPGEGGRLNGPGTGTSDSILGMNYFTGMPTAHVSDGEFVVKRKSYEEYPAEVQAINAGTFPHLAGGGMVGSMDALRERWFPGSVMTSGYRPGANDYHGQGLAIDIGVPGDGQGGLMPIASALSDKAGPYSLEIIHNPNASVKDGHAVDPSSWGATTWAQHANHVHWAMNKQGLDAMAKSDDPSLLGKLWSGVKGGASMVTHFLREQAAKIFDAAMIVPDKAIGALLPSPPPGFNAMPKGVWDTMRDKAREFIVGKADGADSASGSASMGPMGGNADAYAREIARSAMEHGFGKPGAAIGVATAIVESGLRMYANAGVPASLGFPHDAVGSDHDSVGLFQQRQAGWGTLAERMNAHASADLFFNKLGTFDWRAMNPGAAAQRVQVSAYPDRYAGAMGQASAMVNGFDLGGIASGAGLLMKQTVEPERVLSPRHTDAFERMVAANFEPNSAVSQAAKPMVVAGVNIEAGAHFHTTDEAETQRRARNEAARLAASIR